MSFVSYLIIAVLLDSVNEGYLRYTQFRALQHVTSAALSVLSTQVFIQIFPSLVLHYDYIIILNISNMIITCQLQMIEWWSLI